MFELRPAIQPDTRDARDREFDEQDIARVAVGIVGRRPVDGAEFALRKGLGVEACCLFGIVFISEADPVLGHVD